MCQCNSHGSRPRWTTPVGLLQWRRLVGAIETSGLLQGMTPIGILDIHLRWFGRRRWSHLARRRSPVEVRSTADRLQFVYWSEMQLFRHHRLYRRAADSCRVSILPSLNFPRRRHLSHQGNAELSTPRCNGIHPRWNNVPSPGNFDSSVPSSEETEQHWHFCSRRRLSPASVSSETAQHTYVLPPRADTWTYRQLTRW